MAKVIFYEKPGCINNTRQKKWLRESGHEVIEKNLLTHGWETCELKQFFADLPVVQWFNTSAPKVKSGEVDPGKLDPDTALALMQKEPLLIRRPLMQVNEDRVVGFDQIIVNRWIGLTQRSQTENLEVCARSGEETGSSMA